jgi:hypothetical protein
MRTDTLEVTSNSLENTTMQIPVFLLRKLYVKGSLQNVDDGFSFRIKNSLSPGTATAIHPVKVDGVEYPLGAVMVKSDDGQIGAADVNESKPFPIKIGVEITLHVKGDKLSEGEHTIDISLVTKETGKLAFDVKDTIQLG